MLAWLWDFTLETIENSLSNYCISICTASVNVLKPLEISLSNITTFLHEVVVLRTHHCLHRAQPSQGYWWGQPYHPMSLGWCNEGAPSTSEWHHWRTKCRRLDKDPHQYPLWWERGMEGRWNGRWERERGERVGKRRGKRQRGGRKGHRNLAPCQLVLL